MRNDRGRVEGKVAIATRAASGLGNADAIRLTEEGAQLVSTGIDVAAGQTVARPSRDDRTRDRVLADAPPQFDQ